MNCFRRPMLGRVWSRWSISDILVRREDLWLTLENVDKRQRWRQIKRTYRNPDPIDVWHFDSHDKLNPYGISIHGCIDGYSSHEVAVTNNMFELIAKYYFHYQGWKWSWTFSNWVIACLFTEVIVFKHKLLRAGLFET